MLAVLNKVTNKKTLIITVLSVLVMIALFYPSFPAQPLINLKNNEDKFTGHSFTLKGNSFADCRCYLTLKINNSPVSLDRDGNFEFTAEIGNADEWPYKITATAQGRFFTTIETSANGVIKRQKSNITMDPLINRWNKESIDLAFTGLPKSNIKITALTSYFIYKTEGQSEKTLETREVTLDDSGKTALKLPFDNNKNNQKTVYKATISLEGFDTVEQDFDVYNSNFDEKLYAERDAWEKIQDNQRIMDAMPYYSGVSGVQIAVLDINTSRTSGYRYVLDPANSHFANIPISVRNNGYNNIYVNPNYVTILGEDGYTYTHDTATYSNSNYLDSVNLEPAAKTTGYLAFILPKKEHKFTVLYSDGLNSVKKEIYIK